MKTQLNRLGALAILSTTLLFAVSCANHSPVLPDEVSQEGEEVVTQEVLENGLKVQAKSFQEPNYTSSQKADVFSRYQHLDAKKIVPTVLLQKAVLYYHFNLAKVDNKNYITVVDFTKHSSKTRFFVVDMKSGAVTALHVSHGTGSDPKNTGYATKFSNVSGSNASSVGYYVTSEVYYGKHGRSLRIDGLSSTNSNVRERAVVIHGADYVKEANIQAGRSWGCFALANSLKDGIITKLMTGSILYAGQSGK